MGPFDGIFIQQVEHISCTFTAFISLINTGCLCVSGIGDTEMSIYSLWLRHSCCWRVNLLSAVVLRGTKYFPESESSLTCLNN